jgi:SHS2 domain-containing protein
MYEPIAYFDHDADMGIVGLGTLIEEAFENAATAAVEHLWTSAG